MKSPALHLLPEGLKVCDLQHQLAHQTLQRCFQCNVTFTLCSISAVRRHGAVTQHPQKSAQPQKSDTLRRHLLAHSVQRRDKLSPHAPKTSPKLGFTCGGPGFDVTRAVHHNVVRFAVFRCT